MSPPAGNSATATQLGVVATALPGQGAGNDPRGEIMHRRTLLGLSLSLLPLAALGQTATAPAESPPQRKPRLVELEFDRMTPRQQRRVQARLAGDGKAPLQPEEARRIWNGMDKRQRRQAMRRQSNGQPRRGQAQAPAGAAPQ